MKITTKAQQVIKSLRVASAELWVANQLMVDADISTAMWAEIKGIENNINAVVQVLEAHENDSE